MTKKEFFRMLKCKMLLEILPYPKSLVVLPYKFCVIVYEDLELNLTKLLHYTKEQNITQTFHR